MSMDSLRKQKKKTRNKWKKLALLHQTSFNVMNIIISYRIFEKSLEIISQLGETWLIMIKWQKLITYLSELQSVEHKA